MNWKHLRHCCALLSLNNRLLDINAFGMIQLVPPTNDRVRVIIFWSDDWIWVAVVVLHLLQGERLHGMEATWARKGTSNRMCASPEAPLGVATA
jgi:hypothetical protein